MCLLLHVFCNNIQQAQLCKLNSSEGLSDNWKHGTKEKHCKRGFVFLAYNTASLGNQFLTFQNNLNATWSRELATSTLDDVTNASTQNTGS
jgi:hypothetical protein